MQTITFRELVTVEALPGFEVPTLEEVRAYWAAITPSDHMDRALALPRIRLTGVTPQGGSVAWVDQTEGWLWATVPTDASAWYTFEQMRSFNRPAETAVIPQWVQDAVPNWRHNSTARTGLFVRRRIDQDEAAALLDQMMPPPADYPVPEELARPLRAAGWTPGEVRAVWWSIETEADALALAAHSPAWWERRLHWPLWPANITTYRVTPIPARYITSMLAAGVPGGLLVACAHRGITDPDRIMAVRPPRIPDDATRIVITTNNGGGPADHSAYVDAASARRALDQNPALWLGQVTTASGPVLLHTGTQLSMDPANVSVWSDGTLLSSYVRPPVEVPQYGERTWELQPERRQFEAAQHLLRETLYAVNRTELTPELWMPWQGATAVDDGEEVERRTQVRALAADTTAQRDLTLTRYTIHTADGSTRTAWKVEEVLTAVGVRGYTEDFGQHWLYGDEADARTQLAVLDDGLSPVMTVEELAAMLDTTRDAVAQAISRSRRQDQAEVEAKIPPALRPHRPRRPRALRGPRANWYDPRAFAAWWRARPGHGPGRGHTFPR